MYREGLAMTIKIMELLAEIGRLKAEIKKLKKGEGK